jgi:hypothetical protein
MTRDSNQKRYGKKIGNCTVKLTAWENAGAEITVEMPDILDKSKKTIDSVYFMHADNGLTEYRAIQNKHDAINLLIKNFNA